MISVLTLLFLAAFVIGLVFYFLPWIIARKRRITSTTAVFWLNLLLGWSGLMWIVCLLWAVIEQPEAQRRFYERLEQQEADQTRFSYPVSQRR